jgi:hypothetical protein
MRANSKGRHPLDSKDSEENKNNNFHSGKNGRGSQAKDIYSQISGHMMNGGDNMMKKPPGASSYNTQQGFNKASSYTRGNSLTTAGVGGGGYKAVYQTNTGYKGPTGVTGGTAAEIYNQLMNRPSSSFGQGGSPKKTRTPVSNLKS